MVALDDGIIWGFAIIRPNWPPHPTCTPIRDGIRLNWIRALPAGRGPGCPGRLPVIAV
jgi:hypothetical protein